MEHIVDLNDTKRDKERLNIDEEDNYNNFSNEKEKQSKLNDGPREKNQSRLTSIIDPKNILGDNNSLITYSTSKVTYKGPTNVLRTLEERNPY